MKLSESELPKLGKILAAMDSLWLPYRICGLADSEIAAEVESRRRDYSRFGVPLKIHGDGAERLSGERELQRMATAGAIELKVCKKRVGVVLTERGDNFARHLVGGILACESHYLLQLVEAVKAEFQGRTNSGFVLENDILGLDPGVAITSRQAVFLEDCALPLLARGWLLSASDTCGRIGYRVTDIGLDIMRAAKPRKPRQLPEYNKAIGDEHHEHFMALVKGRTNWGLNRKGGVAIPLSAGRWPRRPGG